MAKVKETGVSYGTKKGPKLSSAKRAAMSVIKRMKDDVTYEDMMYELYLLQKVAQGLDDAENGRTLTHEELKKSMSKWLK